MNKQIKKLQLNKETIARLDQAGISGGVANISQAGYTCKHAEGTAPISSLLASDCGGGGGGIVSDDCGTYTMKTLHEWGHECW